MFVQPERYIEPNYLIPDFHLRTDTVTYAESEGIRITSPLALNRDFDGDLRWGETGYSGTGTAPDVGADEGNFIPEQVMKFDSCIVCQGQKYVKQDQSFSVIGINLYVTGTKYPIKVTNFSLNANGTQLSQT